MTPQEHLAAAFASEHAAEAARFLETEAPQEVGAWLAALPAEDAAFILERAVPTAAVAALGHMSAAAAANALARLDPVAAAALLRRLPDSARSGVLGELPPRVAERTTLLMHYGPDQAASRIDPRAPAVTPETTVEQALATVRAAADGALNYVYVVERQRLCGVVSMRELMLAKPETTVRNVMIDDPYSLAADDSLDAVVNHPGWRKAHAMPVVDQAGHFLGVIRYSQFRTLEAELGRTRSEAKAAGTSSALAELFWIGSTALAKIGETALFGAPSRSTEGE